MHFKITENCRFLKVAEITVFCGFFKMARLMRYLGLVMVPETLPNISEQKSGRLLDALIEIGQELASTTDLQELLDTVLKVAREVFCFENAIIRLLDDDGLHLNAAAAFGYTDDAMVPIQIGQGVMGRTAEVQKPILVEDVAKVHDYVPGIPGARCELAVPLISKKKLVGVLNVESPHPGAFSAADIEPLMILGRQAAIAIENARLYGRLTKMSDSYRQLHEFSDRILKSVSLGVYTVDTNKVITSWNNRMADMSGVSAEQAIGSHLEVLFPNLVEEGVIERVDRVLTSGRKEKQRLLHRQLDGTNRFQKRRLAPLHDGEQITGAVVIVEDVTEFKRLLDQTIQSEKLAEVGRLSAGIAHEINNPLSIVAYATELLKREDDLTLFQEEMLEKIETEVERLRTLTGGLLSFSSSRSNMNRIVNLNDLVTEVMKLLRFELQRKSVQLDTVFTEVPVITADPNKLKQVIINLIMNAVHAMKGEGRVVLETRINSDTYLELLVKDDGPGIPAESQEKVFAPFFTTKPEGEGTGLGLYICHNIIREHGGTITLQSEPGAGTIFCISLPLE
jgi:PAS domain S-box-containing protein